MVKTPSSLEAARKDQKCQQWAPCTWCYVQIPFEWTGMSQTYYDTTTNSLLAPTCDKGTIVFQGFYMLAKPVIQLVRLFDPSNMTQ